MGRLSGLPLKKVFVATNRRRRKQKAKRVGFIRKFHIFSGSLNFSDDIKVDEAFLKLSFILLGPHLTEVQ